MNRLADETSPYLRQHAANPVDWYPWGDEALERAAAEDKPVLLSIGYSACHWCHVMAHESFEDDGTAAVMNDKFVNVKVDREERPDVDDVYMQAVQAMTGHGGWPLTVFLAPDGRPFFGGTYFPKDERHGLPGFVQVLDAVHEAWTLRRDELLGQADKLVEAVASTSRLRPSHELLSAELLQRAYLEARGRFDPQFGGLGGAPKFPQAMTHDFLLRTHVRNGADETLHMVRTGLDGMAAGGIYDHVGGGFHRYSVDAAWHVPHFEKMLYDQALLVRLYLHGWQATGEPRYRRVVEETVGYVLRDLRHAGGGFFSAEDADSEGVEGKFYVWSRDEVRELAGDATAEWFGVTAEGNWPEERTNILHAGRRDAEAPDDVRAALPRLFEAREQRVRPGLDDKVLLEWNALFLSSLAEAAAVLGRDDWREAARANARFLLDHMRRDDGRLLRSWQDGRARHPAYAADHAALLDALVTLAEVDGPEWLSPAREVAGSLLDLFLDPDHGGFFTTGRDAEALVTRMKDFFDNATPSANSLAAVALFRLAAATGDSSFEEPALGVLRLARPMMERQATAFGHLLGALEWYLTAPVEIAVVGDSPELVAESWRRLLPVSVRMAAAPGEGSEQTALLEGRSLTDGRATAYVCERFACKQPVTDVESLRAQVDEALAAR